MPLNWFTPTADDPERQVIAEIAAANRQGDSCGACGKPLEHFTTSRSISFAISPAISDHFSRWRCGTAELTAAERRRLLALFAVTASEVRRMAGSVARGSDPAVLVHRWRKRRADRLK